MLNVIGMLDAGAGNIICSIHNCSAPSVSMQQQQGFIKPKEVSPAQSIVSGLAAFLAGAAAAGGAHYSVTARKLQEDGIDPRLRMKALPIALRALALSTVACGTIGALGYMAVKHSGLQMKDTAAVSSLHDAIGLAQQQRELVREEFQKKLHEWETQPSQAGTH